MRYGTTLKLTDHLDRDLHMRVEKSGVITVQLDDHDELSVIELTPVQQVELRDYLNEMILAHESWQAPKQTIGFTHNQVFCPDCGKMMEEIRPGKFQTACDCEE